MVVNASALGTEDVFVTMDGTTASATAGHMVSPGQLRAFRVTDTPEDPPLDTPTASGLRHGPLSLGGGFALTI